MSEPTRIVLAQRTPRPDYAVGFEADAFVVEGVALLPDRRVALRDVYGLERAGAWLWVGAGFVPVVLGGDAAGSERLAQVEAELRARIGALPSGGDRLARLDARRVHQLRRPWLTAALVLGLGLAAGATGAFGVRAAACLLLLLAVGLSVEPVLGAVRLFAAGGAALLAAFALGDVPSAVAFTNVPLAVSFTNVPLIVSFGWAAPLVFVRLRREPVLGVRTRSALDGGLLLVPLLIAHALGAGVEVRALAAATLAAALLARLLLRRWPEGT
jgi:hypothetical protein